MLRNFSQWGLLTLSFWLGGAGIAQALPGQPVEVVKAWIQANPTLRPNRPDTLVVHRTDTPARRFTFRASVFPIGNLTPEVDLSHIRTERFDLFDLANGVDVERLEESLRAIYGPDIYADYQLAEPLYRYPNVESSATANPAVMVEGEVRIGERFAYWLELNSDAQGVTRGRMTILTKADLPRLWPILGVEDETF
ncbi:uncharacterized protein XM38_001720 [Halomicronema hongdechloris C2206]|uniref:Chalcone isomerase domain-containing protein n=2 Tax=Halomicronema hongdechloris TaxID=1209493 RepID=A0A1Z3HG53_9CYAN|nr:uncharacterized protein XM38_001720 [Halomicronema hongdechloris C2206]